MRRTGEAVVLCSLTTSRGCVARLNASSRAGRSRGAVAVIAELTGLATALAGLPAAGAWYQRTRAQRSSSKSLS